MRFNSLIKILSFVGLIIMQSCNNDEKAEVKNNNNTEGRHIFLRIFQRFTAQIFLHHLLIQTRHHDGNKHPTEEVFNKECWAFPIHIQNLCIP